MASEESSSLSPDKNETVFYCSINHGDVKSVICNHAVYTEQEEILDAGDSAFWMYLITAIVLVMICGIMQGLVLTVASLDMTQLKVMCTAGTEKVKKYAKRLIPLAKRHHLIMVSLIIANSVAAEAMPVVLDRITNPIIAVVISATAFLIFGEIIPQAVCSRYTLPIGYYMAYFTWALTAMVYVISYPLSLLLDWWLGKDHGTLYKRKELSALVDMHGPVIAAVHENHSNLCTPRRKSVDVVALERLSVDEVHVIQGALALGQKSAKQVMVKLEDLYMLPLDAILDEALIQEIFNVGHSRIPVYEGSDRRNVIGVFLTKRLILINPKEPRSIADIFCGPDPARTWYKPNLVDENKPLYELLNEFQTGTFHMVFVTRATNKLGVQIVGIVTLEDVIEELLQEEIQDEADIQRQWRLQTAKVKAVQRLTRAKDTKSQLERSQIFSRNLSAPSSLDKLTKMEAQRCFQKKSSMSYIG